MKRIIIFILLLSSCKNPEPVEFRKISNARVSAIGDTTVLVKAEALFFNPNEMGGQVREVSIDVYIDQDKVGQLFKDKTKIKVKKLEEFTVPLDLNLSLKKINDDLLGNLIMIASGQKFELHYKGYIKIKVYGVNRKIHIDYINELKL